MGLRGGNEYPTLVRKFEPKPLRIFLQDGSTDHNTYGGDWWMPNQSMERALTYAGYEVNHVWGEGGHNHKQADEIFPDAMRWLWKDWPEQIKTGAGSEQLQQILIPGEEWKLAAEGYKSSDGPTANAQGEVFFNDSGKCYKIGLDGTVSTFIEDTKKGAGETIGPDGRLYAAATGADQILAYSPDGKSTVVADEIHGNDIAVRHDGGIYVTVSSPPGNSKAGGQVWYMSPKGEKHLVDSGLKFPNGLALSPDQSLLYVDDMRSRWVYSYQVQPDGSLNFKQRYYHLHVPDSADDSGSDGMRVDRDGRLYVTTRLGIQVCDQAGRVNCIIPTPNGKVSNLCFGGATFDTLFATCGDKIYSRKLKVQGLNPADPPLKPAPPKL